MLDFLGTVPFLGMPKMYYAIIFIVGYIAYYLLEVVKRPLLVCADGQFKDFIHDNVGMVRRKFWPTIWCFESRVQTVVAVLLREKIMSNINYRREILTLKDGGEVALDWADDHCSSTSPIVIVLPGITGHSQSGYIKCLVTGARESQIRCVIFNNRGLGGVALKTPRIYCAANYEDLAEVVDHVRKLNPNVPIGATGISLGGMILGNYMAQEKEAAVDKLQAAMIISAPWNIFKGMRSGESGINLLLNRCLANQLSNKVKSMHYSTKAGLFSQELIDELKSTTVHEFDSTFTSKSFGYTDVKEYYENSTLHNKLHMIEVPLLCLNAADDFIQPLEALPLKDASQSKNIAFVITSRGGHIGFLDSIWPGQKGQYMTKIFTQFFSAMFVKDFKLER